MEIGVQEIYEGNFLWRKSGEGTGVGISAGQDEGLTLEQEERGRRKMVSEKPHAPVWPSVCWPGGREPQHAYSLVDESCVGQEGLLYTPAVFSCLSIPGTVWFC